MLDCVVGLIDYIVVAPDDSLLVCGGCGGCWCVRFAVVVLWVMVVIVMGLLVEVTLDNVILFVLFVLCCVALIGVAAC